MADKPDMLSIITRGNIASLSDDDRTKYVLSLCEALGLDPRFKPIDFIPGQNGALVTYFNKGATEALARMHDIQRIVVVQPKEIKIGPVDCVMAVARATNRKTGRFEESIATCLLKDHANVFMKVETKAKRRSTLAVLGLGGTILDESELDGIRGADALAEGARALALEAHVQAALERIAQELPNLTGDTEEERKRAKGDLWKAQVKQLADGASITTKEAHAALFAAMKR